MTADLILAGLIAWGAGAAIDLIFGAKHEAARLLPYVAGVTGSALVVIAGVRCDLGTTEVVNLATTLGFGQMLLRLDPLAGLFLTLVAGLGVMISGCLVSWARPLDRVGGRGTGAAYLLLLGAVTLVLIAGDAFTFLFGWESLTAAFFVLTTVRRRDAAQARAGWLTLGIGKVSGAALLFGFMLLAGQSHSMSFSAWSHVPGGALHDAAYVLIVAGFGAKVGLVPFQVWMPVAYPEAPGPTRAAMAGLAANVGFYGLWRFLGILGPPPIWLVVFVLVLGGLTALGGIAFAAVQSRLDRVIAYSSVENAGVILVGYGVALAGAATGHLDLVAVGLLAASLQVLAHAVAKSALFASGAAFESDEGADDIESLRGVGRRHPLGGTTFAVGALTLAGLPPTIGFVSEWMILESLMQEFRVHELALRLGMAAAGALVALTAGVAALCFARLIGLMILGRPVPGGAHSKHSPWGAPGGSGLVGLAALCFALAAGVPWVIRFISDGLAPVVSGGAVKGSLRSPWVLQPVFANFSALSPSWLFIVMPVGFVAVASLAWALSRGRLFQIRRVPAWKSATAGVAGPDRYSAFGYANVLRHVLSNILGTTRSHVLVENDEVAEGAGDAHVEVRSVVVEPIESYLFRPLKAGLLAVVTQAKRLQSGRLDAYVGYMLFALIVVLAVVAAAK